MAKRRKVSGWIHKPSPKDLKKRNGWFGELDEVLVDNLKFYCVMIRKINIDGMIIEHACIRNSPSTDIPWAEKQRIKNEIFGTERTAIEVFPPVSKFVDHANMYHLWVYPEGYEMPFSID